MNKNVLIIIGALGLCVLGSVGLYFLGTSAGSTNPQSGNTTSSSSCIITISGKKYDVTTFRNQHRGGNIFVCGTDMTQAFMMQHGNNTAVLNRVPTVN